MVTPDYAAYDQDRASGLIHDLHRSIAETPRALRNQPTADYAAMLKLPRFLSTQCQDGYLLGIPYGRHLKLFYEFDRLGPVADPPARPGDRHGRTGRETHRLPPAGAGVRRLPQPAPRRPHVHRRVLPRPAAVHADARARHARAGAARRPRRRQRPPRDRRRRRRDQRSGSGGVGRRRAVAAPARWVHRERAFRARRRAGGARSRASSAWWTPSGGA